MFSSDNIIVHDLSLELNVDVIAGYTESLCIRCSTDAESDIDIMDFMIIQTPSSEPSVTPSSFDSTQAFPAFSSPQQDISFKIPYFAISDSAFGSIDYKLGDIASSANPPTGLTI